VVQTSLRHFKAEIFQGLAHPTRIAIVEALESGEIAAGKLIEKLGLEQANASQHLAVLRSRKVLTSRKVGNQVFYSLRDPVLGEILALLRRYFYQQLSDTVDLLKEEVGQRKKAARADAAMASNTVE
jgi:ArsR family transcriptional regulator